MKTLFSILKGYIKESVLAPLFKMLEATFELFIPLIVAAIIDTGIGSGDKTYILKMCALMIGLGILGFICAVVAQYYAARAAVGVAGKLRHRLMKRVLTLSYSQIDFLGTSTMITRMTSDINQVQNGINLTLRLLLRSPFVVFGAMIMAFTIDADAALVFVGAIPVLCIVVFGIMLITMPMYRRVQNSLDRVTSATRQNLSGARVIRAFCMEQTEVTSFEEATKDLAKKQITSGRISALLNPITFVVINLGVILLIRVGAIKVYDGILTQGLVIALYNYMSQILIELIKMANLIVTMTKAGACATRIENLIQIPHEDIRGENRCKIRGKVEFQNVTANYGETSEPSLENICFSVEPGETVGIIGGTGSGKSTLINLIMGFYKAQSGRVLLDDSEIHLFDRSCLTEEIGIAPQKAELFFGTIRENLLWGNECATDSDLWNALEIAQAKQVVENKDGALDAIVEQGGGNFSGGQRQRLTIARALVKKPAILILDDCTSALDYLTDAKLRNAIHNMEHAPTTFVVSQRAASVRNADRILVLDDGLLVGNGTHEQLLENCPVYQEIYYSQFPKEVVTHA